MDWVPLSKNLFLDKGLTQKPNYTFIKNELMIPIFGFELADAVAYLPLVFARRNQSMRLYGLMGLEDKKNLLVDQAGLWRSRFIPAALRSFPFRTGNVKDVGEVILVWNDQAWFDVKKKDNSVFNEDGSHTSLLEGHITLLRKIRSSQNQIELACGLMETFGLLEPFCLTVKREGDRYQINSFPSENGGVFRINPKKLDELGEKEFHELRKSRALDYIYAHIFSMGVLTQMLNLMSIDKQAESNLKDLGAKIFENEESAVNFDF